MSSDTTEPGAMRKGRRSLLLATVLLALPAAGPARSHEFWIDPVAALPAAGQRVSTDFRVGQQFKGEPYPYLSSRFNFLRLFNGGTVVELAGNEGDMPGVAVPDPKPGLNVIAFWGKPNEVTFDDPALFATYLQTEGLEWIKPLHKARGLPEAGFTEVFSRTVKTLLQVGPADAADRDHATGMPFELVAGANPFVAGATELPVTLLWRGKPAANVQLSVFQDRGEVVRTVVHTDAQGHATIALNGGGRFLINAVHMRIPSLFINAAWESHWASLTFALPLELPTLSEVNK